MEVSLGIPGSLLSMLVWLWAPGSLATQENLGNVCVTITNVGDLWNPQKHGISCSMFFYIVFIIIMLRNYHFSSMEFILWLFNQIHVLGKYLCFLLQTLLLSMFKLYMYNIIIY